MRALLDVNVLIALLDAAHLHHGEARRWLESNVEYGWASCPITQNGCVRILSQAAYPGARPVALVAERLAQAADSPIHEFWPDDASLLDRAFLDPRRLLGARQITDGYLLALAVRHGGRFVTFDRAVPLDAVPGARPEHLVVL
ncbi:MAG: PIN domain-containing protein [Burkholderiaceae bacterium]|nr:PIN domain-containing protein [Burkholderiaceae bacterium]